MIVVDFNILILVRIREELKFYAQLKHLLKTMLRFRHTDRSKHWLNPSWKISLLGRSSITHSSLGPYWWWLLVSASKVEDLCSPRRETNHRRFRSVDIVHEDYFLVESLSCWWWDCGWRMFDRCKHRIDTHMSYVLDHDSYSMSFYLPSCAGIFVGDVLFRDSIGRYDFVDGDREQWLRSIKEKILTLPPNTVVVQGHADLTTVIYEAVNNPFLWKYVNLHIFSRIALLIRTIFIFSGNKYPDCTRGGCSFYEGWWFSRQMRFQVSQSLYPNLIMM